MSTVEELSPDGNCLGVALRDAWRLAGLHEPALSLAGLSTTKDAVAALSRVRLPTLLVRREAGRAERFLLFLSALRLNIKSAYQSGGVIDATYLCLRSMHQLYHIPYRQGHWVVIHVREREVEIYDQLLPAVRKAIVNVIASRPESVLNNTGPTFIV